MDKNKRLYSISSELQGNDAKGFMQIDSSGQIITELAHRASGNLDFVNIDNGKLDISGITHDFRQISLLRGSEISASTNNRISPIFDYISVRYNTISFEYCIIDSFCNSYDEKCFTGFQLEVESLNRFIPSILFPSHKASSELTEHFVLNLKNGTTLVLRSFLNERFNADTRESSYTIHFNIKSEDKMSILDIVDNYINPIKDFISILCNSGKRVSKLLVFEDLGPRFGTEVLSPKFSNSLIHTDPMIDLTDTCVQDALRLYIENYSTISTFSENISPATDSDKIRVTDLINDVEKIHFLVATSNSSIFFRKKLNALFSKQRHLLKIMIPDMDLWSKRIKSYRTYFVHKSETRYVDDATKSEIESIIISLRCVFFFTLLDYIGADPKVKKLISRTREFELASKHVSKHIGSGSVPMDSE